MQRVSLLGVLISYSSVSFPVEGAPRSNHSPGLFVPFLPLFSRGSGMAALNRLQYRKWACEPQVLPVSCLLGARCQPEVHFLFQALSSMLSYGEACGNQSTCNRVCQCVKVWR